MIQMHNRDCMELMKEYPDGYFELAIVDPPYGINRLTSGGMPKAHGFKNWERKKWDDQTPSKEYWTELKRVARNLIVFGGNYFTPYLPPSMGWVFWFKQTGMTFADGELIWTSFNKALRVYNGQMGGNGRIHPTQKPVKLYKWLLTNYAKPGDKILDTHGGSGSICIACHDLGFDLTWTELDPDYYAAAVKRYQQHAAQLQIF